MKTLNLILILFSCMLANAEPWDTLSNPSASKAGGLMNEALACHYITDFTGKIHTEAVFYSRKIYNKHYIMMSGHQARIYTEGKDTQLCSKIEDLRTRGHGVFKYDSILYTNNRSLKEIVTYEFENGLKMQSEKVYRFE